MLPKRPVHAVGVKGLALFVPEQAQAHMKDLQVQDKYGVKYLRNWVDEGEGKIWCLVDAPIRRRPSGFTAKPMGWSLTKSTRLRKGGNPLPCSE
jgi:hypothetical protein